MDPLWSRAVATASKRSRREGLESPLETARSFATGCQRLPPRRHGKEGVSGSSPLERSAKAPHVGAFAFTSTCRVSLRWVWSRFWSFQVTNAAGGRLPWKLDHEGQPKWLAVVDILRSDQLLRPVSGRQHRDPGRLQVNRGIRVSIWPPGRGSGCQPASPLKGSFAARPLSMMSTSSSRTTSAGPLSSSRT
jgi:hypothetical protein